MSTTDICIYATHLYYLYNHFNKTRRKEKSYLITCHRSDKSYLPVPVLPSPTLKFGLIINITDVYIGQRTPVSFLIVQFDN